MAYSSRDYLNLYEQMELYTLLAAVESLDKITQWPWLDNKTKGFLKAFRTRFNNSWDGIVEQLPADTLKRMNSFTDGYGIEFKPKMKNPAQDMYKIRKEDLEDLLETLIIDHCVGCQRDGADVKNCQIRRHQYKCMRITEPRQYKRCEYEIGGGDGFSD